MNELDKITRKMEAFLDGEEEEMSMDFGDVLTIYNTILESTGRIMTLANFISVFEEPLNLMIFDSESNFRIKCCGKETIPETFLDAGVLSVTNLNTFNVIGVTLNIKIDDGED